MLSQMLEKNEIEKSPQVLEDAAQTKCTALSPNSFIDTKVTYLSFNLVPLSL